jgi:hypothetical protein
MVLSSIENQIWRETSGVVRMSSFTLVLNIVGWWSILTQKCMSNNITWKVGVSPPGFREIGGSLRTFNRFPRQAFPCKQERWHNYPSISPETKLRSTNSLINSTCVSQSENMSRHVCKLKLTWGSGLPA